MMRVAIQVASANVALYEPELVRGCFVTIKDNRSAMQAFYEVVRFMLNCYSK